MDRSLIRLGPPGTGKTYSCVVGDIGQELERGTPPEQIAMTTFTRNAAHEAIDRITALYSFDSERLPYVRTLHSMAFKLLQLSPKQVMTTKHFIELGQKLGPYEFTGEYHAGTERGSLEGSLGDTCLFIVQLSRSLLVPLKNAWRLVQESPIRYGPPNTQALPYHAVEYFARGLASYKRAHGLLDFTDFLDECHDVLDVKLFIVDEVQDLTPQQWRFARQLGRRALRVVLAGDDDQSIYEWAGADVDQLLKMAGRREVLPVSHRLPGPVHAFAQHISSRIKRRLPKTFAPREGTGSVNWVNDESEVDLRTGSWLCLARTNWLCKRFVTQARQQGVVYHHKGVWSNQTPDVQAVLAYEAMRAGRAVARPLALLSARYADAFVGGRSERVEWGDIVWPFPNKPDWMDALIRLGVDDREYIRALRANGESLTKPGRVTISTIHQAKGGECDNVVLLSEVGARVENSFWADMDAELRVWYVGITRARSNLFMVNSDRITPLTAILAAS